MDIINEVKEEEKENTEIIETLKERLKHNEYDFFKKFVKFRITKIGGIITKLAGIITVGGGFMDIVSKAGVFLGAIPIFTKLLTGTFRYNIFEFITGMEREHLREKNSK